MRSIFKLTRCLMTLGLLMVTGSALAESKLNMTPGVTPMSRDIYDLHMVIFGICVVIGILVFSVMFYAMFKHRKSKGAVPATFHESTTVEIVWAVIPLLILVAMAIPATKVLIDMENSDDAAVNIKVVGYQWKWKYEYLDEGISYFSNLSTPENQIQNKAPKDKWYLLEVDKPMVVPINQKIRFLITSNDVIHSWWVPALGVKKDAVPGFIHEMWATVTEPGIYRGQCAELCGQNHGFMPIVVEAKTQADYEKWLQEQGAAKAQAAKDADKTMTKEELMTRGKTAYDKSCAACHKADGSGMPPAFPALKDSPVAIGPVKKHIEIVLDGVSGTAMQAFGPQLSDADIAAIVTYERTAWGNDAATKGSNIVQPADVKAARSN